MILTWISTGNLHDPYDEFMIKVSKQITKGRLAWDMTDDYWDRRYTVSLIVRQVFIVHPGPDGAVDGQLRDGSALGVSRNDSDHGISGTSAPTRRPGTNHLPGGACIPAFLEPWKYKILLAGKYLNVIRECGTEVVKWDQEQERVSEDAAQSDKAVSTPTTATVFSAIEMDGLIRMNDVK